MREIANGDARWLLLVSAVWLSIAGSAWAAEIAEEKTGQRLRVLQRFELPIDGESLVDVRWAGKDRVYLLYGRGGVKEVELREGLPVVREVMPDFHTLGFGELFNLATSDDWVVAAPTTAGLTWRQARTNGSSVRVRTKPLPGIVFDLDVQGDRLVLLGVPSIADWEKSDGGVVWVAEIDRDAERWRPLLEREEAAEDFDIFHSRQVPLGSIRFLGDGSLVVAPGFLPEVLVVSSTGKVKARWTESDLFGAAAPAEEADEASEDRTPLEREMAQLATSGVVDDVLPLPDGPAVLVRDAGRGARWRLGILGPEVRWMDVPSPGVSTRGRLRGDVDDDGRIVLVGTGRGVAAPVRIAKTEILVLEVPY